MSEEEIDFFESLIIELIKKISLEEFKEIKEIFENNDDYEEFIKDIDELWNKAYEDLWEDQD